MNNTLISITVDKDRESNTTKTIYINTSHIYSVESEEDHTLIHTDHGTYCDREPIDDFMYRYRRLSLI